MSPLNSACLDESVKVGRILGEGKFRNEETCSEGTAGGVDKDSFTLQAGKELVDEWLQVEDKIKEAVDEIETLFGNKVEGAAGLALARWHQVQKQAYNQKEDLYSIVIVCGGNAS